MAVQTVYRHFGSKDELVLAVLEESLAAGCEYISEVTIGIVDPLDRLEQIIRISIIAARDSPQLRLHARERVRLSETHAPEVEEALSPLRMLLIDALSQAAASGEVSPVDIERDADLILHLLLSYAYAFMAHAIPGEASQVASYVWGFCLAALRRGSTSRPGTSITWRRSRLDQPSKRACKLVRVCLMLSPIHTMRPSCAAASKASSAEYDWRIRHVSSTRVPPSTGSKV